MSQPFSIFHSQQSIRANSQAASTELELGLYLQRSDISDQSSISSSIGVAEINGPTRYSHPSSAHPNAAPETLSNTSWGNEGTAEARSAIFARFRSISAPNPETSLPSSSSVSNSKKRALQSPQKRPIFREQSEFKKPRLQSRARHKIDLSSLPGGPSADRSPPSPLFFSSHSESKRPPLPPRFSSFDAGAKMLSTAKHEETGLKTVKLARGSLANGNSPVGSVSPAGTVQSPLVRFGSESSDVATRRTPDGIERSNNSEILGHIGITELLDQDDRPTFIIDLYEKSHYQPGRLQVVYANHSLRAFPGLYEMVIGSSSQDFPNFVAATAFPEFKAWILSFVKNYEPIDVSLPSFVFGGITWTCSSLRKRFRLISGNLQPAQVGMKLRTPSAEFGYTRSAASEKAYMPSSGVSPNGTKSGLAGRSDYFGNVAMSDDGAVDGQKENVPSTKRPDVIGRTTTKKTSEKSNEHSQNETSDPLPHYSAPKTSPLGMRPNEAILGAATAGQVDEFCSPKDQDPGFFDWTRLPVTPALPRHIKFARSVDWGATSIGPIEYWPSALRGMCNLIMASPYPAAMYWGDDFIAIYNEAYVMLAGQKHPQLMGQSYREAWAEIWDAVKDVFANAKLTGQATMKDDDCLFLRRSGYLEETYFSWSIIPLVGDDGSVVGLYNPCFEKTRRKIAERRMLTLREVGEKTASAREIKGFWGQVLKGLEYNEPDTPFVILYSVTDDLESDGSSNHSSSLLGNKQCILEGALGVPDGHKAAPYHIDLKTGTEGFGKVLREAMTTDKPVILHTDTGTLDSDLIGGMDWRGFGVPCRSAVVCPIHLTTGESILGFLILGINPRRPYDDDYDLFVQLLARQLATSMASVVLFEEEIKRGQHAARLAALDRIELSQQLAVRTQQAVESETKFTRMAEFAPVGMYIANSEGRIIYCNDTWYEIAGHSKEVGSTDNWLDSVKEDDHDMVNNAWRNLVDNTVPMNIEFRFKAPWEDRNGNKGDTWVLASAYPEKTQGGHLQSIFGSITNISQQKWAEDFQKRRMEEAVEMKRQQENFIDITSHEMRNPLSAILQCADEISTSLAEFKAENGSGDMTSELVDNNIDAAQTIALCAQHQKRIVDDILTLSKLDSALLLVTPIDVQPMTVVQRALKMFEGELQTADIQMHFKVDDSLQTLAIDWVRVDPSRLLQVLINLTTNAIKFTTTQAKRTIVVTLSASIERPSKKEETGVTYFPTRSKREDLTDGADWGNGEEVFIHFAVQDTGRGLSDSEKKLLFLRFSQVSPRTHVQYGGSGLGLFISRELVELQGGEIGVASESGVGSTFAFYVKAKRSTPPKEAVQQLSSHINPRKPAMEARTRDLAISSNPTTKQTNVRASSKGPTSDKKGLQVLIVEDNIVNQRVLQKQLRNLGCTVYVANHGGECIEQLEKSHFYKGHEQDGIPLSVILMDQEMPVMDGLTCTREIREMQQRGEVVRHVPIIAVTANARTEQIDTAIAAGMVSQVYQSIN